MYSVSSRLMYGMLKTREKSENDLVSDHKQTNKIKGKKSLASIHLENLVQAVWFCQIR